MTLGLGNLTLTMCVSDGDGPTPSEALPDLVSFLVLSGIRPVTVFA